DARILICRELCIPVSFKPEIPATKLPDLTTASGVIDADTAFMINQFASRIPRSGDQAGLKQASIQLDSQQKLLEIELQLPANMQLLDLFPELSPEPELDAPIIAPPTALENTSIQSTSIQNTSIQSTSIQNNSDQLWRAQFPIQRKRLPSPEEAANLVIRTSQGDFELPLNWQQADASLTRLQGTPVSGYKGGTTLAETSSAPSLWLMLLMALAGGLILNLMPCVLPVLSIKVLHLIKHSELSRTQVRSSFIATAAGIISSFLLLAGVLIALKASGQAIGWGIQFQQPLFIAALALIVVIFAGNLWGLFEFRLPSLFSTLGHGQTRSETNSHS
ncbi:hypothetical protein ABMA58_17055, partial [Oceanospirillum sp. HFRX-1_2]